MYRERDADGALPAWFDYRATHNTGALVSFVRDGLACAARRSPFPPPARLSAKAFAAADRMISAGLADAAIVGGVDSLCLTTLYGFSSLELTSPEPCRPGDAHRQGLSIGEAAAFALLERADAAPAQPGPRIVLAGWGESSDAHHMSAPHPDGRGARGHGAGAAARGAVAPRHWLHQPARHPPPRPTICPKAGAWPPYSPIIPTCPAAPPKA